MTKKQLSGYFTEEEEQQILKVKENRCSSLSSTIRYLVKQGLALETNVGSTQSKPVKSKKPTVCPECGRNKNELGNSTLIVNGNGTWYCTQEDCRAKGRWDE